MDSSLKREQYIDLKNYNGRLFVNWVLTNFKKYKIPEILQGDDSIDPCAITKSTKFELTLYQRFIGSFLDYRSPYREALIYHGLGSGKSALAINLYNILYNYSPNWNIFILIKASLRHNPWMSDLKLWLEKEDYPNRMKNIIFVHYDSPFAHRDFIEAVKSVDSSKKNMFIIDEVHRFISNVYSNLSSGTGIRASTIYDYIYREKKDNNDTRVLLLSATPVVNNPFELALLFNLLRPDIFPLNESEFLDIYVSSDNLNLINPLKKNMFQRNILGLVSYYIGNVTSGYARSRYIYKDLEMTQYHMEIYNFNRDLEKKIEKSQMKFKKKGKGTFKSLTRLACNFVFPPIDEKVRGDKRPRPSDFKLSSKDNEKFMEGILSKEDMAKLTDIEKYNKLLNYFITSFKKHAETIKLKDKKNNHNLEDDIKMYNDKYRKLEDGFDLFLKSETTKSQLFELMYMCNPKSTFMIFEMSECKGPLLIFSNYVKCEGLEMDKIYLELAGYVNVKNDNKEYFNYAEIHGSIDREDREKLRHLSNTKDNAHGKLIKAILISPAIAEGVSFNNIRMFFCKDPYWNMVRLHQAFGRGLRRLSHCNLPSEEREIVIYLLKCVKKNRLDLTADQEIYNKARNKENLLQSFLDAVKEAAIDCELFKNDNMKESTYSCFQFDETSLFDDNPGPVYSMDSFYNERLDNGLNSINSIVQKVKVIKIKVVKPIATGAYSDPLYVWYNPETGIVYDYEFDFPIGKIAYENDLPAKLDSDTYILDKIINIPIVSNII